MRIFSLLKTIPLRRFSNGNLWRSEANPLPISEQQKYTPYFDFKYGFGQGGTLTMRLNKSNYQLLIHTLWEDYSVVEVFKPSNEQANAISDPAYKVEENGEGGKIAMFSDEWYSADQIGNQFFKVYARIPEYYSYDLEVNGDIIHENTPAVSSKIYGDVRAITPKRFFAYKLKTEKCEISSESVDIQTYLESFSANVISKKNIAIKKCAISGTATIVSSNKGNIQIHSLFTNPERRLTNVFCLQSPFNYPALRSSILGFIENTSHIKLETHEGNIMVQSSHGAGVLIANKGDITVDQIANQQIYIQASQGKVTAHFYHILKDSYVEGQEVEISLEETFKENIFLMNQGEYIGEHNPERPTVFIKGMINPDQIIRKKAFGKLPSFMSPKQ